MSLLRAAIAGAIQFRADLTGTPAPYDDFWYSPLGTGSSTGMRITAETAKRISAAHACVGIIGRTVAMCPLKIFTEQADGGKKLATNHPVYDVLYSQPNTLQTAFEFRQMMQGHLEFRGNAYAEILPGPRGAVDQLVPLHPDRVTLEVLSSGRPRYRYQDPLTNSVRYLVQEEVFHLKNWSDDGYTGQSTLHMGADTFGVALAAQDYSARFFRNDARPSMALVGGKFRTKEAESEFIESWRKSQTGANRHRATLMPEGMDIKTFGLTAADAQLLEARKFSRIEICSIFGVPPHLIGETEKTASYASVEQFNILFSVQCILPRLILWEQTISRDLILSSKYFPKFSLAALLRGDTASRFNAYQVAIQNGWLSQNDVRMLEDMNPIADGNTYWRPLNWAPLGQLANPSPAVADIADTSTADPGAGGGDQASLLRGRLKLLATCAAEPCVRKEVNALRRLSERCADQKEFAAAAAEFYREHATFLADRLRIPLATAREYCDRNTAWTAEARTAVGIMGGGMSFDALLTSGMAWLGARAAEVGQAAEASPLTVVSAALEAQCEISRQQSSAIQSLSERPINIEAAHPQPLNLNITVEGKDGPKTKTGRASRDANGEMRFVIEES
jgi:HK97 family phage portal protein